MKSTIKLFKAVPVTAKKKGTNDKILKKTIKKGFVFAPEVISNYSEEQLLELISTVEEEFGLTSKQLNSTFHKSWEKIKTASMEQLVMEQLVHYFTTYGFEELGVYSKESIFIPNETLKIPRLKVDGLTLIIIKGYTKEELKEKLLNLLNSGIALKEDTIEDVDNVAKFVELTIEEVEQIKNKEVKCRLYIDLNIIPENPIEFLRYLVYLTTESTLLIKSPVLIKRIKDSKLNIVKLIHSYKEKHSLNNLASIFFRYKPIFLAFRRKDTQVNWFINKIRKYANKHHKPMKEDFLNSITANIIKGKEINTKQLIQELNKVNTFRKIRLAYALQYRTKDVNSILYRIRNGKGYAKEFVFLKHSEAKEVLDIVLESITHDLAKNVKGKKTYIPENIHYTLPSTEKQFTEGIPAGSYVTVDKDMLVGVHWNDVGEQRIDLDLSMVNATSKVGWDSAYRNRDRTILFSGDITAAPNGATEVFYVKKNIMDAHILHLNYFNFRDDVPVPFKLFVAKEKVRDLPEDYMVNSNDIILNCKTNINERQKILGLLVTTTEECRFYFTETYLGDSITSSNSKFTEHARQYLFEFYRNSINLKDLLVKAGAVIVEEKEDVDIDLSPETLEKDTILKLLY